MSEKISRLSTQMSTEMPIKCWLRIDQDVIWVQTKLSIECLSRLSIDTWPLMPLLHMTKVINNIKLVQFRYFYTGLLDYKICHQPLWQLWVKLRGGCLWLLSCYYKPFLAISITHTSASKRTKAVFLSTGSMTAMHRGSSSQVSFFIQTETGKTIPQLSTASNYNITKLEEWMRATKQALCRGHGIYQKQFTIQGKKFSVRLL